MQAKNTAQGQVIKGYGGVYYVDIGDRVVECNSRGRLKLLGDIYIGDYVDVELFKNGKGAIASIHERINNLVRPYVSNIDAIIICIAPVPAPDYLLVDKLLIGCIKENIEAIICINKIDMVDADFLAYVHRNYSDVASIVEVSATTGQGMDELGKAIYGKFVAFSGQSAVGKSSIINTLLDKHLEVGELSKKTLRGKHTTRYIEIFKVGGNTRIADTCGFSVLELPLIEPCELSEYFIDFEDTSKRCRFKGCSHINEPDCAVKVAVENGFISQERYDRYVKLYKDLEERWRNRYE